MGKKILTRKEFEDKLTSDAQRMNEDEGLKKEAIEVLVKADTYSWIHQTTWMGEPILNLPQDLFVSP